MKWFATVCGLLFAASIYFCNTPTAFAQISIEPRYLWDNSTIKLLHASVHFWGWYDSGGGPCPAQPPAVALVFDKSFGPLTPATDLGIASVPGPGVPVANVNPGFMCL